MLFSVNKINCNEDLILKVLSSALPFMLFTVKYITFYFVTENVSIRIVFINNYYRLLYHVNVIMPRSL